MLELTDISKIYDAGANEITVLDKVSFTLNRGAFCALTGASGSGKTTLMNIIGLIDMPTSGSFKIAGEHIEKFSDVEASSFRNQTIGFVFQAFHLLPAMSAIDNVGLPLLYRGISLEKRRSKAEYWLSKVGLADKIWNKPDEMSGGQKQRVAIARALITEPILLLADEPTGNLDSISAAEIFSIFKDLNISLNMTILIVTHDDKIARSCNQQIFLQDGRIIKQAGFDEI